MLEDIATALLAVFLKQISCGRKLMRIISSINIVIMKAKI
jgi:hypothetical protein